jgi:hypothetical protein
MGLSNGRKTKAGGIQERRKYLFAFVPNGRMRLGGQYTARLQVHLGMSCEEEVGSLPAEKRFGLGRYPLRVRM